MSEARSKGAKRGHEVKRERAARARSLELAREAFLDAAYHLGPGHLRSFGKRDPAHALLLGAIGMLRMAQADPDGEVLEAVEQAIAAEQGRRKASK